ncbi:unnamed protein product, partial [Polarella glacialis]
ARLCKTQPCPSRRAAAARKWPFVHLDWDAEQILDDDGEPAAVRVSIAMLSGRELGSFALERDESLLNLWLHLAKLSGVPYSRVQLLYNRQVLSSAAIVASAGVPDRAELVLLIKPLAVSLATASFDGTARLWNLETGECVHQLKGHRRGSIESLAFSPDGTCLATASMDCTVKVWDVELGTCLRTLRGHEDFVRSVAFSPCGGMLVTASEDRRAKLWDSASGNCLRNLRDPKAADNNCNNNNNDNSNDNNNINNDSSNNSGYSHDGAVWS